MYIPIILGTARQGRQSEKAAKFIEQETKKAGLDTEIIDVRDYKTGVTDNTENSQTAFKEKISKASGVIIVSPEYNRGYPGELKILLDTLYEEYAKKPVGICGVSSGMFGGARMVEMLKKVCIELHMVPIRESVYFSKIKDLFSEENKIKDDSYHKKTEKFLEELIWYASVLEKSRKEPLDFSL